ncbi:MAG: hypothetical protein AMXMBFR64_21650 [Myxococcales bacterium]
MRRIALSLFASALLVACGDDGGSASPDAGAADTGAGDAQGPADVAGAPDVPGAPDVAGDAGADSGPGVDAGDVTPDTGGAEDAADAVDTGLVDPPQEGERVVIDLAPFVASSEGGGAYARQITAEGDLIGGDAATARVGDWLIGNDHVRFIVQGESRAIGVCPYGGGLIDGDIVRPAGEPGRDSIGAVCLFLNLGMTLDGETYEVLHDGTDGAAVIAVTGIERTLDFLNLKGAISQWVGIPLDFAVDPDTDITGTVTTYYILRPQDRGVRMVTAVRNDGGETMPVIFGELIDSGGVVEFFNPASALKGFGYGGFAQEKMDFLGFKADATAHIYAPRPLDDGRPGAGYLTISGVAGLVLGTDDPLGALLGGANAAPHEARHAVEPGGTVTAERWVHMGDGALASATEFVWKERGVALGQVLGAASDAGGAPVAGARVSLVDAKGAAITQAVSAADGTFTAAVPPGTYTLDAIAPGRSALQKPQVSVEAGAMEEATVPFSLPGALSVKVTNPAGQPTPAKVRVTCDGPCAVTPTSQNRDVTYDFNHQGAVERVGVSGEATIPLPPGKYRVVVSRGTTHTLWPEDYDVAKNPGHAITVEPGQTVELFPVVAKALDTAGWLSGDLHVHAVNSPDAPVGNRSRVASFMAEATDVLVSTDHDFVTDYAPVIAELGGEGWLASIVGVELTTFDYGHYNSFPLVADLEARNGGAVDWAGGDGPCLTPDSIFDALHAFPGEQVIQVNHPNSGYFFAVDLDAATGMTFAEPEAFRMAPIEKDPVTGDTKLWSEKFTAMELYNGFSVTKLWSTTNWWMTFLNRGFRVTGTAVTDTHSLIKDPGGVPCSYVRMPEGKDTIAPLDAAAFAAAVNAGRLVGSNGPLLDVRLVDPATGDEAEVGETLALSGKAMQLVVNIQTPRWYTVDKVEVFSNATSIVTPPGQLVETKPPVAFSQDVEMTEADLMPAVEGGAPGARYVKTVVFDLEPGEDAWYVVLATGNKAASGDVRPIVMDAARALAFTNPLFVDVDGGGWKPPLDGVKVPPLPPAPKPGSKGDNRKPIPATRALVERGLHDAKEQSCHGGHGLKHEP